MAANASLPGRRDLLPKRPAVLIPGHSRGRAAARRAPQRTGATVATTQSGLPRAWWREIAASRTHRYPMRFGGEEPIMSSGCELAAKLPAPGRAWPRLASALVLSGVAACASPEPGPVEFAVTAERVARAGCGFPYERCPEPAPLAARAPTRADLAERASTSVIAIDQRGHYAPVAFTLPDECGREPIRQPTPGLNCEPQGEGPPVESSSPTASSSTPSRSAAGLQSPPPGKRYHLLVFVHGGLNLEQGRLERAFVDANRMLAEQSLAEAQARAEPAARSRGDLVPVVRHLAVGRHPELRRPAGPLQPGRLRQRLQADLEPALLPDRRGRERGARAGRLGRVDLLVRRSARTPTSREIGDEIGCEQQRPRLSLRAARGRDDRPDCRRDLVLEPGRHRRPGRSPCRRSRSSASRRGTRWSAAPAC